MAEQRQPFRFRLPWSAAPAAPRQVTQAPSQPPAPRQAPTAQRPSQVTQAPSQPTAPRQATAAPRPSQVAQAPSQPPTPQQAPAASRPSQETQAPSQPPAQRPPFRPAGVAPAQPKPPTAPPTREEPQSPSRSSQGTSKPAIQARETQAPQGSPASTSQTIPPTQVTSRPASPTQVSSKLQQATKALPQSPSPSRGGDKPIRTKATTGSPPTSSVKHSSPTKKQPTVASDITQNPKDLRKRETSQTPLEEPKPVVGTAASPKEPRNQPANKEPTIKPSTKLSAEVSSPKQEPKPQIVKEYNTSYKQPKQILKGNHDDPKKEAVIERKVISPKARTIEHPLADQDEEGLHSEKEVFDIKEVFKKTENRGHDTENETRGDERVARYPHKQANAEGHKPPFQKEIKENLPKLGHKQGAQQEKLLHQKPLSIITLAGENIGATMHLSSESINKERPIHIHRGYKLNSDRTAETTEGEGSSRKRKSVDTNLQEDLATKSYVNNNAQGINNSLVFNSSVTERNPGVHVLFTRNQIEPQLIHTKLGKEKGKLDTHKVEFISTPAENLAYAPTIRRRCLQSLLLESSSSDPEKPRRHGCRVGRNQKSNDGTINVL
ncbi:proteoglycan 4-like [Chenopodium quinoa]|uniref:Uncharacterized protein n=1 Tax=Chenopodium quinoa TaxID=63459 RepID=A0A803MRF4_CHEQI|nr:proteoglycan 4-like [Chenopodium quinoa]